MPRTAFTLLELILAMAIFAGAAALVMPVVGGLLTDRKMIRGVDQVRAEMIRLRVYAMRQGRVMKIENMPGENKLQMSAVSAGSDAINSADAGGAQSSLMTGADQTIGVLADSTGGESWTIELPDEITVKAILTSPVGGATGVEAATVMTTLTAGVPAATSSDMPAIYFYPTGQTSNALLILTDSRSPDQIVQLRGLTGDVSVRQ